MADPTHSFVLSVSALSEPVRGEMYSLFSKYYVDVNPDQFARDLSEKTEILFFRELKGNRLIGFSTVLRKKFPHISPGIFLYSGDTVIHEDYWGSKMLQRAFLKYVTQTKLQNIFKPVYWMLISKGFKTYLMMRKNSVNSWPRPFCPTPKHFLHLRDEFYQMKFGSDFSPQTGLIRFKEKKGAVKGEIADPKPYHLRDPDVAHFLALNPAYRDGVELACVTEIQLKDFILHFPKHWMRKLFS